MKNKLIFGIVAILSSEYMFASSGSDQAMIVAMGIVGGLFAVFFMAYNSAKEKGITTKQGRKDYKKKKEIALVEQKISELKIVLHKGIINQSDFDKKLSEFELEKRKLLIEFYFEKDKKYHSILDAHKKGFITDEKMNENVQEIRAKIQRNLR